MPFTGEMGRQIQDLCEFLRDNAREGADDRADVTAALNAAAPEVVLAALRELARTDVEPARPLEGPSLLEEPSLRPEAWSDWLGGHYKDHLQLATPRTPEEVAGAITSFKGRKVKATASRHSDNDLARPADVRLDLRKLTGVKRPDRLKPRRHRIWDSICGTLVHVAAGTTIKELNAALAAAKPSLALPNVGSYDGQQAVGAFCTGTHGSGQTFGPLAELIRAIEFVDQNGNWHRVEPPSGISDPTRFKSHELLADTDLFDALRVGIGVLGVVTGMVIEVRNAFYLAEWRTKSTWDKTQPQMRACLAEWDHYEILINPYPTKTHDQIGHSTLETKRREVQKEDLKLGIRVPDEPSQPDGMRRGSRNPLLVLADGDFARPILVALVNLFPGILPWILDQAIGALQVPWYNEGPIYVDQSDKILLLGVGARAHGFEVAVPLDRIEEAVEIVLNAVAKFASLPNKKSRSRLTSPISLRFVAASSAMVAPQYSPPWFPSNHPPTWVMLEIPRLLGTNNARAIVKEIEPALKELGGRPHWGQENYVQRGEPEKLYPRWDDFVAEYRIWNSSGMFSNDLTARLLDPQATKRSPRSRRQGAQTKPGRPRRRP
jgi:L-gulonolactone oxidase